MIAIIDYGMGNLRSVQKALEKVGAEARVTQNAEDIRRAGKVVLPGVGAIKPAMDRLSELNLVDPVKEAVTAGKPFLGICLGLQLLFERSDEGGDIPTLGVLPGKVVKFTQLKVPHMGWNQLVIRQKNCPLYQGVPDGAEAYFCHSFYVQPKDAVVTATTTEYGVDFTSSVCQGNIFGVQFHPEKSQNVGLRILENFVKL